MPPRIGFLGVGWIGRDRMEAMLTTGAIEAVAIVDPSPEMVREAAVLAPGAAVLGSLDELLEESVDGVVIATPSALHAQQSIKALEAGAAVFCQKPLGRNADEVRTVVDAARKANRLLSVDLSYRSTQGMRLIRDLVRGGELGRIFSVDLLFHNAYGPDKPWFYDRALSGGGCVMDLGVHLIDLALWVLDYPRVENVGAVLLAKGASLVPDSEFVEDYASATFQTEAGALIRLACSWKLQAGCDAAISAGFYGTDGGAVLRNIDGSFYRFMAEQFRGTSRTTLVEDEDDWGGRAAADWVNSLATGGDFDPAAERLVDVSRVIDKIYRHGDLAIG